MLFHCMLTAAVVSMMLVVHTLYKQGPSLLYLILLSVLNSHQSTNPILLYKRRLYTDEASGKGILVVEYFIGTPPKAPLHHYSINGSLTDSFACELRSIRRPSSSLVPSPHHATGCRQPIAIMPQPPALLWLDPACAVHAAASMVRIGDTLPSSA